jgi:hypothetical protein
MALLKTVDDALTAFLPETHAPREQTQTTIREMAPEARTRHARRLRAVTEAGYMARRCDCMVS